MGWQDPPAYPELRLDTLGNDIDGLCSILHWQEREKIPVTGGFGVLAVHQACFA
jgi:hypothetical protein